MQKEYTILVNGRRIPVTSQVYHAYYRHYEHERYLNNCAMSNEVSREKCLSKGMEVDGHLAASPADVILRRDLRRRLYAALGQLDPPLREAIWALALGETTERALAKKWGVSKTTVHKRKQAALDQLRRSLMEGQ